MDISRAFNVKRQLRELFCARSLIKKQGNPRQVSNNVHKKYQYIATFNLTNQRARMHKFLLNLMRRVMKKAIFIVVFGIFVLLAAPVSLADVESLNSVIAVVNKDIITQAELNAAEAQAKQQLAASANPNALSDNKIRQLVLQQLIDQKLQLEMAKNANLTVSDAQTNQAIQHIAKQNNISVSELKNKLEQQGVKFSAYQKLIHDQMLVHQVLQNAVGAKVHVTDADIEAARQAYQSEMASQQQGFHIIDIVAPTKDEATKIAAQLKNGVNIDTAAPNQSNDLGWRTAATLPTLFLDQLKNMKTGDISAPIEAPNGYHILKLVGTQGSSAAPTKEQLQSVAYQMQFQKAVAKWMKEMRKTAYIKINP